MKYFTIFSLVVIMLGIFFTEPAQAVPPVCPNLGDANALPGWPDSYVLGCFVDKNGDEWTHGGTYEIYDPVGGGFTTGAISFPAGTFIADAFNPPNASSAPPGHAACPIPTQDFYITITFNDGGAGTPPVQEYCLDGVTVDNSGLDLRSLNGGNPISTQSGPTAVSNLQSQTHTNTPMSGLTAVVALIITLTLGTAWIIIRRKRT